MLFYYRIFIPLHPSEAHNTFANIYNTLNLQNLWKALTDEMLIFWAGGGQTQTL